MKVKHISIFCAYIGFLLALSVLKEEISLWNMGICFLFSFTILNHLKWRAYPSSSTLNFLAISLLVVCFFLPRRDLLDLSLYVLFTLILIKFLGPLKTRDLWQVYTLNLFLFSTAAFSNLDLNFGIILFLFFETTLIGICFLTAQQVSEVSTLQRPLIYFSFCLGLIAVLGAGLFFAFLPRSPYAFFFGFGFSHKAKTGFTENIDLSGIQEIRTDSSVAFRALMSAPLKSPPYWRGMVYDTYQNGRWQMRLASHKVKLTCPVAHLYHQTIFLEPYLGKTLFTLDYPLEVKISAPRAFSVSPLPNLTFVLFWPIFRRIEYRVSSCPVFPISVLNPQERYLYLQVPPNLRPPLQRLLQRVGVEKDPPAVVVKKLVSFLQKPPFKFKLQVPKSPGDPVLTFLFHTHQGWCEHFASALTLLLRTGSIPARFVGGYYGGTWNSTGNYYLVRQKDAHAWVEYWDGDLWQRVDPTPASLEMGRTTASSFFRRWVDYLRLRWYAYIINYDFTKQRRFFRHLKQCFLPPKNKRYWQIKRPDFAWRRYKWIPLIILSLGWLSFIVFRGIKRRKTHLFLHLCEILRKNGYSISPTQGGLEIADMIKAQDPKLSYMVREFVETWYLLRYGKAGRESTRTKYLKGLLRKIASYLKQNKSQTKKARARNTAKF